jgi:hypothetical protein
MKKILFLLLVGSLVLGCGPTEPKYDPQDGLDAITEAGFESHLKVLASDEYMGRMPFTEGETKTIAYLQEEAKKLGLEPGNGDSYLQEVPMVEITTETSSVMTVKSAKLEFKLEGFKDYVLWTQRAEEQKLNLRTKN